MLEGATHSWHRSRMDGNRSADSMVIEKDVAIIGAGPVGLFAVFQCGMMGFSSVVFDSLEDIGGQCAALYPEKPIYDIPSQPSISGENLIARLEEQAKPFSPTYCLGQQVISLEKQSNFWIISSGTVSARVKAVIIAAGAGAFGPNRPPLENLALYEGRGGVQYMVRRKEDLRNKKIIIAGGGDSAVDWALSLAPIAQSVHVVHRRDKFRAVPESVQQLKILAEQGRVTLHIPYQLASVQGEKGILTSVSVKNDVDTRTIEADILLSFFGLAADLGPISSWNLGVENHAVPVDWATCRTKVNGIYAIGDIASYKNKPKLILSGFHEATLAAHDIRKNLFPDEQFHFEHSTTRGVP